MSVDLATVKRVARLARIAVSEDEANRMVGELNGILGFVEQRKGAPAPAAPTPAPAPSAPPAPAKAPALL